MRTILGNVVACGLFLVLAATASAQTESRDGQSNDRQKGQSQSRTDSEQSKGQARTVCGELAGVTVVGETMIDYGSGRAATAQVSYLTILGEPSDSARSGDQGGKDGQEKKSSDASKKGQGSDQGQKDSAQSSRDSSDSNGGRRAVYLIAVGPDTQVRDHASKGDQEKPGRDQSHATFEKLELGDRVEVEFTRNAGQGQSGRGGQGQEAGENQSRHGRHRMIRGVAKCVTILSTPDRGGDPKSESKKSGDPSSRGEEFGSASQGKKSDSSK